MKIGIAMRVFMGILPFTEIASLFPSYRIHMKSKTDFALAAGQRFHIRTLGCKINQYEAEALREAWLAHGLAEGADVAGADVVVVNACAVTSKAVADVRATVRAAHRENPSASILVVGCVPEDEREAVAALPGVALILPQRAKAALAGLGPENGMAAPHVREFPPLSIADYPRARAVLKVQDGCSHHCAYCIVPLLRGPAVSRPAADVVAEAERLLAAGFREITLSGVNLRQYGMGGQLPKGWTFWRLVRRLERELAPQWAGRARLRLSSLDPAQLDDEALETLAASRLVAPHLHLSLQSLAPKVLYRMRRGHYGPEEVHRFLDRLGQIWPVFGLGADFIAGFPGETDEDAAHTMENAAALPLTYAHVFPFSPRPGTPAAVMDGQTPQAVKKERAVLLRALVARKRHAFLKRQARRDRLTVVLEDDAPWRGRDEFYVECRFVSAPPDAARRRLAVCRPVAARQGFLEVEPVAPGAGDGA